MIIKNVLACPILNYEMFLLQTATNDSCFTAVLFVLCRETNQLLPCSEKYGFTIIHIGAEQILLLTRDKQKTIRK